jgi:ribosomal protein L37AE/L43A
MEHWSKLWGCQGLAERVTVRTDRRLRSSIARTSASKLEIRLHPELEEAPESFTTEVVCHELAHLACQQLYGAGQEPHGAKWRHLVELAGFRPAIRTRVPREDASGAQPSGRPPADPVGEPQRGRPGDGSHRSASLAAAETSPRLLYTHTCPVCHFSRTARRAMPSWRCPECTAAGLGGELQVQSVPARTR